jgi:DNA-binding transcriptional MerR regulator
LTKGPHAFRTISEASDELGVPQHVLRFWETKFSFIRPMKRAGGRRFYRPQDIAMLRGVRSLLHDEGLTIKAVQRLHREMGLGRVVAAGDGLSAADGAPVKRGERQLELGLQPEPSAAPRGGPADLTEVERRRLNLTLEQLVAIKTRLDALLAQDAEGRG